MKVVIDRFEGDFAVAELPDRTMANMPKCLVPDAKEGDVVNISIDKEETDLRKSRISEKVKNLFDNI